METLKKLEQEVKYQDNHLQQAFDKLESYFEIELEKEHRDCIKVIVMKTILLAESQQDLNHARLQLAENEMQNEKFWEKMSEG
jgi:hypothetical protein|tara:strand:+ start:46 stop:294 length:249 start_codon:yes stop_codon:yes gene_type:complete